MYQYLQTIVNKRQEVSSLTLEGVEAVACIEEQEKDEDAITLSDHDESIANDTTMDENAIAAPGTHATSCKEVLGTTKENCETSIRQEETPVEKGHPQTIISRK